MSDFKAKMRQIRFPLGLCPKPRWGSSQHSPDPLAVFKGPTSKETERRRREGKVGGERPYAPAVASSWLRHWDHPQIWEFGQLRGVGDGYVDACRRPSGLLNITNANLYTMINLA